MMAYLLSVNREELAAYQREADKALGYPEGTETLVHVGGGIHAPKELGRAINFAPIEINQKGDTFAIKVPEKVGVSGELKDSKISVDGKSVDMPTATQVAELPEDWYSDKKEP